MKAFLDKYPVPPPPEIKNSTAPPSAPGDPIVAGVFNAPNWEEYIALVRNQGLEVDDDTEPAPKNFTLVDTPTTDTIFEGHTWGWDGIDFRAVVAQNQNEPYFKKWLDPPKHLQPEIVIRYSHVPYD